MGNGVLSYSWSAQGVMLTTSTKVKKERRYTSFLPICLHGTGAQKTSAFYSKLTWRIYKIKSLSESLVIYVPLLQVPFQCGTDI
jgi:hypothetical protein